MAPSVTGYLPMGAEDFHDELPGHLAESMTDPEFALAYPTLTDFHSDHSDYREEWA